MNETLTGTRAIAPMGPKFRRIAVALAIALGLSFGYRALVGGFPAVLTAPEVDALEGGVVLAEALTGPQSGGGIRAKLQDGFVVSHHAPRASGLAANDDVRRNVTVPPVPRWIAALGVSVLPSPDTTSNALRAGLAATLIVAFALFALLLHFGLARGLALCLLFGTIPEARDALVGFGYGAAAVLSTTLLLIGFDKLAWGSRPQNRGILWATGILVIIGLTLALGTHPFMCFALLAVFFVLPFARRTTPSATGTNTPGLVALPPVPLSLVAWPILALVGLVLIWPTLWTGTGKKLIAYLLESGFFQNPPHASLAAMVDPSGQRSGQGIAAIVQTIAWMPIPLLALAVVGAFTSRRHAAVALPLLAAVVLGGLLDGGINGARLSLWPFIWIPTLWCAAGGVDRLMSANLPSWAPQTLRGPVSRVALPLCLVAALLEVTGVRDAMRGRTSVELDFGVPLALLDARHDVNPTTNPAQFIPAFKAIADHFEWGMGFEPNGWRFSQGNAAPAAGMLWSFNGIYTAIDIGDMATPTP